MATEPVKPTVIAGEVETGDVIVDDAEGTGLVRVETNLEFVDHGGRQNARPGDHAVLRNGGKRLAPAGDAERIERFTLIAEIAEAECIFVALMIVQAKRAVVLVHAAGRIEIRDVKQVVGRRLLAHRISAQQGKNGSYLRVGGRIGASLSPGGNAGDRLHQVRAGPLAEIFERGEEEQLVFDDRARRSIRRTDSAAAPICWIHRRSCAHRARRCERTRRCRRGKRSNPTW